MEMDGLKLKKNDIEVIDFTINKSSSPLCIRLVTLNPLSKNLLLIVWFALLVSRKCH